MRKRKINSPAIEFLRFMWEHQGYKQGHSWRRLNICLRETLFLAIRAGLLFDEDDWSRIMADPNLAGQEGYPDCGFNGSYWVGDNGIESAYSAACAEQHDDWQGANESAIKMIEKHLHRQPWLYYYERDRGPKRLCVGLQLWWPPVKAHVLVSSFGAKDTLNLVERKYEQNGYWKTTKRHRVTREKLAELNRPFLEAKKAKDKARRAAAKAAKKAEDTNGQE